MAVLSDADRRRVWSGLIRRELAIPTLTKADYRAAVDAADAWVDANAASFNNALPAAFKNNASTAQKALLLMLVTARRFGFSFGNED